MQKRFSRAPHARKTRGSPIDHSPGATSRSEESATASHGAHLPLPSSKNSRALAIATRSSLLVAVDTMVEEGDLDAALELLQSPEEVQELPVELRGIALQKRAAILLDLKRLDEAYQSIIAVIDDPAQSPRVRAVALHNRGQYRWRISDSPGAIGDYLAAARTKEAHEATRIASYINAAWLLIRERNFQEAIACCKEGLALSPLEIGLLSNLGFALLLSGKDSAAAKVYQKLWDRATTPQQLERAGASDIRLLLEACPDTPGLQRIANALGRRRDALRHATAPSSLAALLTSLTTLIAIEETQEAKELLLEHLSYPPSFDVSPALPELLQLIERLYRSEFSRETLRILRVAARQPKDPDLLLLLAQLLLEDAAHGIATTLLAATLQQHPSHHRVLSELIHALEHGGRSDEIIYLVETLQREAASTHTALIRATHTLLMGMKERSQELFHLLPPANDDVPVEGRARLERMLQRLVLLQPTSPDEGVTLSGDDLRGWSYVCSGTVTLHTSPIDRDLMKGRYAVVYDNPLLVAECLEKLLALIAAGYFPHPRQIVSLDDHGALILANSLAHRLQIPAISWEDWYHRDTKSDNPTLFIAYNLASLSATHREYFATRQPEHFLWAHAVPHSTHGLPAPDVTSLWCRDLIPVWESSLLPAPCTEPSVSPPPTQEPTPNALLQLIRGISRESLYLEDLNAILALGKCAAESNHRPLIFEQTWATSPVVSRER